MKLIVAVDREWGIGYRGELLATVKEDLAHFRELTAGKTIVYGSVTLRTFPSERPLKDRINLILSTNPNLNPEGAIVLRSVEELIDYEKAHPEEDIVVVGGASVYKQLLPYCDAAYVPGLMPLSRKTPISRIWMIPRAGSAFPLAKHIIATVLLIQKMECRTVSLNTDGWTHRK